MKGILSLAFASAMVMTAPMASEIEAEDYIKYRENLMNNAKTHTQGIVGVLKGKLNTKDNIVRHARALHEVSMMFTSAFPEGSDFGETRAKEKIWSDWKGFEMAAKKNQDAIADLVKAAESKDVAGVGDAMGAVGKTCKGCHKEYRSKK